MKFQEKKMLSCTCILFTSWAGCTITLTHINKPLKPHNQSAEKSCLNCVEKKTTNTVIIISTIDDVPAPCAVHNYDI